jgi:DNA-binding winged helix-turn-helix (wHTH) protein/tetratricopeptide (TPR) repeat protein
MRRVLTSNNEPVPLPSKVFDLLWVLVQQRGTALSKAALMEKVWPDTRVEEGSLTQTMFVLRKALGERPNEHRYIVTIPGVGYRFVAPVTKERADRYAADPRDAYPSGSIDRGRPPSLAVLPFTSLGSAAGEEYIELGITDALITKLSTVRQVTVRPTTAVLKYHALGQDPIVAAGELGVDIVVHGTIQRSDDRLRVAVHIIHADDGTVLWAGVIKEKLIDLFAVEDSIASQVTRALTLTLSEDDRRRLEKRHTENTDAYHAYLKGRFFWNKRTEQCLRRGIEWFGEAIKHDPRCAAAYVGIADCYNLLSAYGSLAPKEGYPQARAAAEQALRIDDRLAEAHASLAYASLHFYWDWDAAGREFQLAIDLNPNYATAHQWHASFLAAQGRFEASLAEIEHALKLDPLSVMINTDLGWMLFFARQYDRAIEQLRKTIEMDPNFALAHWLLGLSYRQSELIDDAITEFRNAVSLSHEIPFALASLGNILGGSGKRKEALAVLAQLERLSKRRYVSPHSIATVHAGLNQKSEAIAWLNSACGERSNWVVFLNVDPVFDTLRSDGRLKTVLRKVGLPA